MSCWKQKEFFLSTFKALPHDAGGLERPYTLEDYRRIVRLNKEAGINLIENAIMSRQEGLQAAEACEREEVRFLIQNITGDVGFSGIGGQCYATEAAAKQVVEEQKDRKYLEGYFVWDEMGTQDFPRCHEIQEWFRRYDGDRLAYSLIVPSYGAYWWEGEGVDNWENSAYAQYAREFVRVVDPPVICVDYYPFWIHGYDKTDLTNCSIWRDMGLLRSLSLQTGKPFWFYFQGYAMTRNNDPAYVFTRPMLSVQMYCALAYGVKCLSYFSTINCLVDGNGKKLDGYDEITEINHRVKNLGSFLFEKTSEKLYHFGITADNRAPYYLDDPEESELIVSAPADTIVGVFGDGSDKKYVLVASKDYRQTLAGRLELRTARPIARYLPAADEVCAVADMTTAVELEIPAGEGILFIVG